MRNLESEAPELRLELWGQQLRTAGSFQSPIRVLLPPLHLPLPLPLPLSQYITHAQVCRMPR